MFSSLDDARGAVRRENPDLVILTGAVHEPHAVAARRPGPRRGDLHPRAARAHRLRARRAGRPARRHRDDDEAGSAGRGRRHRAPADRAPRLQERTGIIGESAPIQEVLVKIEQMAPVSSTVLIQGESGTGKELVAKALHDLSPRRGKPFIAVNCAALPETLLESELFGHEKGAFTGAAERRLGRFELADTGTIFLDEIGEIPLVHPGQAAARAGEPDLLPGRRHAADQGGRARHRRHQPRRCASAVAQGEFRDDLYYRLNVLNIYLPPLRERREDIPLLVRRFIREFARAARPHLPRHHRRGDAACWSSAPWPGNVRELRNLIESMVVLAPGRRDPGQPTSRPTSWRARGRLLPVRVGRRAGAGRGRRPGAGVHPPEPARAQAPGRGAAAAAGRPAPAGPGHRAGRPRHGGRRVAGERRATGTQPVVYRPGMTMAEVEKAAIEAALREYRGNRRRAAEVWASGSGPCTGRSKPISWNDLAV